MRPKLILMLTHNDVTVPDAIDYFEQIKDLMIDLIGFKEIGLEPSKMRELNNRIHIAGFKSFLEVVEYDEDKIEKPTLMAVDMGFDYLAGTVYYSSIWDIIDKKINYFPFCGTIYGRPAILDGTIEEITIDAKRIELEGANGFDLIAYRYKYPKKINDLITAVKNAVSVPIVLAGSINSFKRLHETIDQGIWGFTIGSAFFEKKFVPDGTYRDNVRAVIDYLQKYG